MSQNIKRGILRGFHAVCVLVFMQSMASAFAGELRRVVSDYAVTPEKGHGVVRTFFYGPNTVIEFENTPSSFSVVDEQGKQVEFEPEGRFIRLIGRPSVFTAMFSGRAATFRTFAHVAKVPKPTVDELAKFDNFYVDKGKPLEQQAMNPAIPTQSTQVQVGPVVAQVPILAVARAADPVLVPTTTTVAETAKPLRMAAAQTVKTTQTVSFQREAAKVIDAPNKENALKQDIHIAPLAIATAITTQPKLPIKPEVANVAPSLDAGETVVAIPAAAKPVQVAAGVRKVVNAPSNNEPAAPPTSHTWRLTPLDVNLRLLITKMAASQVPPWTVIWQVEKDFPIESHDETTGDFKTAVRYFVSSTEFTDTKAKPCFHSNFLVRIVRQTVVCDPTK